MLATSAGDSEEGRKLVSFRQPSTSRGWLHSFLRIPIADKIVADVLLDENSASTICPQNQLRFHQVKKNFSLVPRNSRTMQFKSKKNMKIILDPTSSNGDDWPLIWQTSHTEKSGEAGVCRRLQTCNKNDHDQGSGEILLSEHDAREKPGKLLNLILCLHGHIHESCVYTLLVVPAAVDYGGSRSRIYDCLNWCWSWGFHIPEHHLKRHKQRHPELGISMLKVAARAVSILTVPTP
jgi:hypothetical protein